MRMFSGVFRPVFGLFLLTVVVAAGCQKTTIQYGQDYVDNGLTNIILVDSIQPVVTTVFRDSVVTSQSGTVLAGNYIDPYFGKISASGYFQIRQPDALTDLLANAQYDSLVLRMNTNGTFYGDTTLPITLAVNQLAQELKLAEGQTYFFNTSAWPVAGNLGTRSFVLKPQSGDSANIRLSDALGQDLYNKILNKSAIVKDKAQFTDYFKGIQIAASSQGNIIGLKDSIVMRLYYHQTDIARENLYFDFKFTDNTLQFNNVTADRSGTPLTAISFTNTELLSTAANNQGYLQPLTGLYLKISFPNIRKLLERTDYVKIIKAQLIVKPIINSYSPYLALPPTLNAFQTDGSNDPGLSLSNVSGGNSTIQTGNLVVDYLYGTGTQYSYDVTSYLQNEITNSAVNKDGLLLLPPADKRFTQLNRLVIGDGQNAKNKLQLNLYYISVNK